jgi:hypothetical protein
VKIARQVILAVAGCVVILAVGLSVVSMRYAAQKLEPLREKPGYASAEEAMRQLLLRGYPGGRVEIVGAGNDAPGLRYVVARVWPARTGLAAGSQRKGPKEAGCYFLRMDQGWVYLPEDDLTGPIIAVGKALLDRLPGAARLPRGPGKDPS